jgi:hypothetical protein
MTGIIHGTSLGYISCGQRQCQKKHKRLLSLKSHAVTKEPRKELSRFEKDWINAQLKRNQAEEKRIKKDFKNYYFGPGDIFHDVIVSELKNKKRE